MAKHKKSPQYVLHNMYLNNKEEFKQIKRKQIRAAESAVRSLSQGCAYLPGHLNDDVREMLKLATKIKKGVSVKEWIPANE